MFVDFKGLVDNTGNEKKLLCPFSDGLLLPQGIEENEMYCEFDPIVDLTREVIAREILFRVRDSNQSHIGILDNLRYTNNTFMLFKKICIKAFYESKNSKKTININMEILDLLDSNFIYFIFSILKSSGIDPSKINFELLENDDITPKIQDLVFSKLRLLTKIGFNLSIDDLFSKFSTKRRVADILSQDIPLDVVKIDGDFFQTAYLYSKYGYDSTIINSSYIDNFSGLDDYIKLLKSKNIKVLVEWVETEDMFIFSKSLGVEYFQGKLFRKSDDELKYKI